MGSAGTKFNKNGILTGQIVSYCLVCEENVEPAALEDHVELQSHNTKLGINGMVEKYALENIRKVPSGYYCQSCNIFMRSLAKVKIHILDMIHVNSKLNGSNTLQANLDLVKKDGNNIVAFGCINIDWKAWNAVVKDTCFVCDTDIKENEVEAHFKESKHMINVIQAFAVRSGWFLYRKIDEKSIQCLTCNLIVTEQSLKNHFSSKNHEVKFTQASSGQVKKQDVSCYDINKNLQIKNFIAEEQNLCLVCNAVIVKGKINSHLENYHHKNMLKLHEQWIENKKWHSEVSQPLPVIPLAFEGNPEEIKESDDDEDDWETDDDDSDDGLMTRGEELYLKMAMTSVVNKALKVSREKKTENEKKVANKDKKTDGKSSNDEEKENKMPKNVDAEDITDKKLQKEDTNVSAVENVKDIKNEKPVNGVVKSVKTEEATITGVVKTELNNNQTGDSIEEMVPKVEEKESFKENNTINTIGDGDDKNEAPTAQVDKQAILSSSMMDFKNSLMPGQSDKVQVNKEMANKAKRDEGTTSRLPGAKPGIHADELALQEYAEEHNITYRRGSASCKLCAERVRPSLTHVTSHVRSLKHRRNYFRTANVTPHTYDSVRVAELEHATMGFNNIVYGGMIINNNYFVGFLSHAGLSAGRCQLCCTNVPAAGRSAHVASDLHRRLHRDCRLVTSLDREYVREVRHGVYQCGYCNQIYQVWDDLMEHLMSRSHIMRRMAAEKVLAYFIKMVCQMYSGRM